MKMNKSIETLINGFTYFPAHAELPTHVDLDLMPDDEVIEMYTEDDKNITDHYTVMGDDMTRHSNDPLYNAMVLDSVIEVDIDHLDHDMPEFDDDLDWAWRGE
jgi:hypothetical protein